MAGRRYRGVAAGSAIDLLTRLVIQQQLDDRERRRYAEQLAEKYKYEAMLEKVKRGAMDYDFETGQFTPSTPPQPQVPSGLEPSGYEYSDPYGRKTSYARPEEATGGLEVPETPTSTPFSASPVGRFVGGIGSAVSGLFGGRRQAQPAPAAAGEDLSSEFPDPSGLSEGQTATDTETGQKYVIRNGQWQPL